MISRILSRPRAYGFLVRTVPKLTQRPAIATSDRSFTMLHPRQYDGVYKELRSLKSQKTWLQALKDRNEGKDNEPVATIGNVKPEPKRMKDSYHSLVGFSWDWSG